jgi:predicted DNA binding protein
MRKAIIEVNSQFFLKYYPQGFFDNLESIEGKALLRLDFEKRIKIALVDIKMKEGKSLEDFIAPQELKIVDVIEEKGTTYTCLIKVKYEKDSIMVKNLQFLQVLMAENIIFDLPFLISKEKMVLSIITDSDFLKTLLQILKPLGLIKSISFLKPTFTDTAVLSSLTDRQKEIIIAAQKNGYYTLPRKITLEKLSQKLGISKATTTEHLQKAENQIISRLIDEY